MICCHSNLNADRVEPGMVAQSDAYPPGMLKVAGLILTSGKTFGHEKNSTAILSR